MKKSYNKLMIFFLNIFSNGKSHHYSRSIYYKRHLDESKSIEPYLKLINDLEYGTGVETNIEMQLFDHKKDNEISKKDVIRNFDRPNYSFVCEALKEIEILFYRRKLGSHKTKLEFHFFKNKLFLYTYKFSYLSSEDRKEIIEILDEKYLEKQNVSIQNSHIEDKNHNIIMLRDNLEFSIKYLDKNSIAFKTILKQDTLRKFKVETKRKSDKEILYEML